MKYKSFVVERFPPPFFLFKADMSPNKSNSCCLRDGNISIMTPVFCLHLHNQRGVKRHRGGTQGKSLQQLLCGCCCCFRGGEWGGGVCTNGAEWESLIWSRPSLDRPRSIAEKGGKFNKRQSKKLQIEGF